MGMLRFDPSDPYPLLPARSHSYADAQGHAAEVDRWLGLQIEPIEKRLQSEKASFGGLQLWIGLPIQAMLTPFTELREMLARVGLSAGQTVIDLGAGYGRMGFVIARHHPGVRFVGYEYVAERVHEGARRLRAAGAPPEIELLQADLGDPAFAPPGADFYFIYDYGTREAIDKTLEDLRRIAAARPITVIGRGRASRDAIERGQPWLSQVREPEHFGHYSIYRS